MIECSRIMHGMASLSNEFTCAFVFQFHNYCRKASIVTQNPRIDLNFILIQPNSTSNYICLEKIYGQARNKSENGSYVDFDWRNI